jgi:N-methylhydantoinase A
MDEGELEPSTLARLAAAFNAEHERTYGHSSEAAPIQFVNLRLTALGLRDKGDEPGLGPNSAGWAYDHRDLGPLPPRPAYFGEAGLLETPVIRRADLRDSRRAGPLIVEEYDATTVVPPGCMAWLDQVGNILIEAG